MSCPVSLYSQTNVNLYIKPDFKLKTQQEKFAAIGVEKGQSKGRIYAPGKLENLSQNRRKKKEEKNKKRGQEKKKQRLHSWLLYWLH